MARELLSTFCCFERGALFNRMARAFSLALFNARGVGRELAAIFLALRGSCGALRTNIRGAGI